MFDYDEGKMSFGLNKKGEKGGIIKAPEKPKGMSPGAKFGIVLLIFSIIAITIVTVVLIVRCMNRSRASQTATAIAYSQLDDAR